MKIRCTRKRRGNWNRGFVKQGLHTILDNRQQRAVIRILIGTEEKGRMMTNWRMDYGEGIFIEKSASKKYRGKKHKERIEHG